MWIFIIIIIVAIGLTGTFMVQHIKQTIDKQFKYYVGSTVYSGDKLQLDKDVFKKGLMPILTVKINKQPFNLLLDSGANINLLNKSVYDTLGLDPSLHKPSKGVIAAEGNMKNQEFIAPITFKHINKSFTEDFEIMNMDNAFGAINTKDGIVIHGILGSKFFNKHRWMIDFEELVVWTKK